MIAGMLIFPDMTQLDFTGPYGVFAQLPGCEIKVIARTSQPVAGKAGCGTVLLMHAGFRSNSAWSRSVCSADPVNADARCRSATPAATQ